MRLLDWVQARDRNAVVVGAVCGPLLGLGIALATEPPQLVSGGPTGAFVTQPPRSSMEDAPVGPDDRTTVTASARPPSQRKAQPKQVARVVPAEPTPAPTVQLSVFASCPEARAAGRTNIPASDPQYGPHLDRDGDGLGCDSPPPATGDTVDGENEQGHGGPETCDGAGQTQPGKPCGQDEDAEPTETEQPANPKTVPITLPPLAGPDGG